MGIMLSSVIMKFEILNGTSVPKIGFGTWSFGGGMSANPSTDARSLAALHSALELGFTHFDTAEMYAAGHTEELLGQAVREYLFLSFKFIIYTCRVNLL